MCEGAGSGTDLNGFQVGYCTGPSDPPPPLTVHEQSNLPLNPLTLSPVLEHCPPKDVVPGQGAPGVAVIAVVAVVTHDKHLGRQGGRRRVMLSGAGREEEGIQDFRYRLRLQ